MLVDTMVLLPEGGKERPSNLRPRASLKIKKEEYELPSDDDCGDDSDSSFDGLDYGEEPDDETDEEEEEEPPAKKPRHNKPRTTSPKTVTESSPSSPEEEEEVDAIESECTKESFCHNKCPVTSPSDGSATIETEAPSEVCTPLTPMLEETSDDVVIDGGELEEGEVVT